MTDTALFHIAIIIMPLLALVSLLDLYRSAKKQRSPIKYYIRSFKRNLYFNLYVLTFLLLILFTVDLNEFSSLALPAYIAVIALLTFLDFYFVRKFNWQAGIYGEQLKRELFTHAAELFTGPVIIIVFLIIFS